MAADEDKDIEELTSILESLSRASEELCKTPMYLQPDINSPAITTFLDQENTTLFLQDSSLFKLSQSLTHFKSLINTLKNAQDYSFRSFIQRRLITYEILRVGKSIGKEIELRLDRERIENLVFVLQESLDNEEKLKGLEKFERRISEGFDRELQGLILKAKIFPVLESILFDSSCTPAVREKSGMVIAALAQFNKDVFVGYVLMGFTIRGLVLMGTCGSLQALISLMKLIRFHLVDEMELNGEIPKIIGLFNSEDLSVCIMAFNCILEMAYFGRKEVIETMLECGLIEKLVNLQRSELGGDMTDEIGDEVVEVKKEEDDRGLESCDEVKFDAGKEERKRVSNNHHPFAGCIARFAVRVEVGEGMEKWEKKEVRMEILRRAREASVSEAEAATIVAEVLWGSSP